MEDFNSKLSTDEKILPVPETCTAIYSQIVLLVMLAGNVR